jgi:transcriptional regulator with XRE-family HTH domain
VKGLRREEVALLAGVSIDYYVRMERGNLAGASKAVLDGIAGALQLDEAERAHLFDLARALYAPLLADPRRPVNNARFIYLDRRHATSSPTGNVPPTTSPPCSAPRPATIPTTSSSSS